MKTAKHVDRSAYTINRIKQGSRYSTYVDGGFAQREASEDGLIIDTEEIALFIPNSRLLELGYTWQKPKSKRR